jgi:hypothetical protein
MELMKTLISVGTCYTIVYQFFLSRKENIKLMKFSSHVTQVLLLLFFVFHNENIRLMQLLKILISVGTCYTTVS